MKLRKFFIELSTQHDLYYRVFLITITILIITGLLPQQVRFSYDYASGNVWHYDNLKAPFDFPVYKSASELSNEESELLAKLPSYYRLDTSQVTRSLEQFTLNFDDRNNPVIEKGKDIIRSVYVKGIIEKPPADKSYNDEFMLVYGNKIKTVLYKNVISKSAVMALVERELIKRNMQGSGDFLESIIEGLQANIIYDDDLTKRFHQQALNEITPTRGLKQKGTLLLEKGKVISKRDVEVLESLKKTIEEQQPEKESSVFTFLGYLLLTSIAIGILITFLWLLRKDILLDNRKLTLLFILIAGISFLYTFLLKYPSINLLVVPICILPLAVRAFFDTRTALFTHVLTMLILGTVAPNGFEFVFLQVIAGMVAIFSIVNMRRRAQLFIAAGLIFLAYFISYLGLSLINAGNLSEVNPVDLAWLGGSAMLTLFTYPLIFLTEKFFGVTSDFSLMELTDFNHSLLRELSIKAPGTFQHSLQVANLAEAAIYKIGGNSLLVRVGALYHDIGKIDMPLYFIENQSTQMNPHDELSFDESAAIIISHVIRGIEKARKNNLPDAVIDFIRTHHGTMMVQYFYQSYLKNYPDQIPNEDDFRYPGPKPYSKETAVLMMADSVEASARSLPHHDAESLDKLVENIISQQTSSGQFENCDITYRDITNSKRIFKKMLSSIYHVRVAYPGGE